MRKFKDIDRWRKDVIIQCIYDLAGCSARVGKRKKSDAEGCLVRRKKRWGYICLLKN
jgi:hypothetical protein